MRAVELSEGLQIHEFKYPQRQRQLGIDPNFGEC